VLGRRHDQQPTADEPRVEGPQHPASLGGGEACEGRDVELEEIWGEPVRRAKSVGVPVPRLEMLYWLIKRLIAARKSPKKRR